MWCRNASNQLSALVDGELAPVQERAVRGHVENCPRCSEELSRMHSLVELTRGIPMEAVPAGLYTRTLTRLAYAHAVPAAAAPVRRARAASAVWLWPAFAGAAAAVVIAGMAQAPHQARIDVPRGPAPAVPSVSAPAPVAPHSDAVAQAPQIEPSAPRVAVQPAQPAAAGPRPVVDPAAASPSVVPPVTRVASVSRPSRPAARAVSGDARATVSRGAANPGASTDPHDARVQPDQPDQVPAPEPMMADVPDAPTEGNADQPATTEMAATVDPEATMRMAGFTPDAETSNGEDEGAQMLRMYLAERNRTVPQPPAVGMGRRRHPKPL